MSVEKLNAGVKTERTVAKKEIFIVGQNDNPFLNGYIKLWFTDGTTTLLSPAECTAHGIVAPGHEAEASKAEEKAVAADAQNDIEAPVEAKED